MERPQPHPPDYTGTDCGGSSKLVAWAMNFLMLLLVGNCRQGMPLLLRAPYGDEDFRHRTCRLRRRARSFY